jgi:hypothetical protein
VATFQTSATILRRDDDWLAGTNQGDKTADGWTVHGMRRPHASQQHIGVDEDAH